MLLLIRKTIFPLVLFLCALCPYQAQAQCFKADKLIITKTVADPITNFDFSYLDLTQSGMGPQLFTLTIPAISTTAPCPAYQIRLIIKTETNVISEVVYEGLSGVFSLTHTVVMTSNDFFLDQGDSMPSLHRRVTALENDKIQKILLNTATVPTGKLFFTFKLEQISPMPAPPPAEAEIIIAIANIRYLKIISPGSDVSRGGSYIPELFTTYPQFIWQSDLLSVPYAKNAVKFIVSVFENPDDAYPISEITSTKPLWLEEFYNTNFAQYPVFGVKPLVPGRTYFWQATGILQGPVSSSIKSELFAFKVANWNISALSPAEQDILKYLEMILGGNYAYLMKDLRTLKPDQTIILDNKKITLGELGALARNFALSKESLKKVTLE